MKTESFSCHFRLFTFNFTSHVPFVVLSLFLHFLSFSCRFLFNILSLLIFLSFLLVLYSCFLSFLSITVFVLFLSFSACFSIISFDFPFMSFMSLGFPFTFLSWHYFCFHVFSFRFIILISRMFLPFPFKRFHFISPFVNDGQTQRCKSKIVAKPFEVHGGILTATSLLIHLACVLTAGFSRRFNPNN